MFRSGKVHTIFVGLYKSHHKRHIYCTGLNKTQLSTPKRPDNLFNPNHLSKRTICGNIPNLYPHPFSSLKVFWPTKCLFAEGIRIIQIHSFPINLFPSPDTISAWFIGKVQSSSIRILERPDCGRVMTEPEGSQSTVNEGMTICPVETKNFPFRITSRIDCQPSS